MSPFRVSTIIRWMIWFAALSLLMYGFLYWVTAVLGRYS